MVDHTVSRVTEKIELLGFMFFEHALDRGNWRLWVLRASTH